MGQTTKDPEVRLRAHLKNAAKDRRGQRRVHDWLRSIAPAVPQVVVLETSPPGGLDEAERAWIACLRVYGCRLTNLTDGGTFGPVLGQIPWNKGLKGHLSDEIRAKMSASARQRRDDRSHTLESRKKISDSRRGTSWIREAGRKGGYARAAKVAAVRGGDAQ